MHEHCLRAELLPALKELLRRHFRGLEELVQGDGKSNRDVLHAASVPVVEVRYEIKKTVKKIITKSITREVLVRAHPPPEIYVEHWRVYKVGQALDVEDLLKLSSSVYYRIGRFGVNVQL